jgi:ABC-type multidrug transport system fused ATPase/permease subunit
MSFSIGTTGPRMGPRGAIRTFGEKVEGQAFDLRIILRLLAYLRPHWQRMLVAFLLMLGASGLTLAAPYLVKVAIDEPIAQGDASSLTRIALLTAATFVALYLASAAQRYLLSWVGQRVLAELRTKLFSHLQTLSLGYHDTHVVGLTLSRLINDVAVINELLSQGLITLIGDTLLLVGIVVVMLSMSPRLALLAFSVLPLMLLTTILFARRAKVAFRQTRSRIAAVVGDLAEDLSGMRVIQAFAQEGASHERFDEVNRQNRDTVIAAMSLSFVFLPTVEFLGMLATGIVLWFGGLTVARGELSLGIVVAFLAYVTRFFQPIQELSQLYTTMQAAMAGGERVLELLDTQPEVRDHPHASEMPPIRGRIELRQVSFAYRDDTRVLHDVNLTIEPGQTVALVGPTGAGKTSIANLVARLYDATDGAVLIDQVNVRDVTQQSLRRQMGLVPQDPFLFPGTIADNIRFGRPQASDGAVEEGARLANAHQFIVALPKGYATEILEGGVNLSLGQRQLICIARAVLADPRILILDEATASVDTVTEVLIQEALQRLFKERTALVIAHRLSTILHADQICVLQAGRIVERGRHQQLLADGGLYRDLYERQFIDSASRTQDDMGIPDM